MLWGEAEVQVAFNFPHRVPKINGCFILGEAEVQVAFNDRAELYHSRNLVTERDVIGLCDHVTERDVLLSDTELTEDIIQYLL